MGRDIKVLIVDDSVLFREALSRGIANDREINVVGVASNPYEARDKIIQTAPNVMILDVNMPQMNGIDFLKKLMPQYPLPTIVISSVSENVFDSLKAGAVDFIPKPSNRSLDSFISELISKIKTASIAKTSKAAGKTKRTTITSVSTSAKLPTDTLIAMGASTGGTEALATVLQALPANMPPIVIVQHMPPNFTTMFANRLNNSCKMSFKEAENGDILAPGKGYVAPGGTRQMTIKKHGNGYMIELKEGEKVSGHCPSVDALFLSVAKVACPKSIGIILTGMGADGAQGLLEMRKRGAKTIGQDEQSCVVYGMPKVAYEIGAVQKQVSLSSVAYNICNLLK